MCKEQLSKPKWLNMFVLNLLYLINIYINICSLHSYAAIWYIIAKVINYFWKKYFLLIFGNGLLDFIIISIIFMFIFYKKINKKLALKRWHFL